MVVREISFRPHQQQINSKKNVIKKNNGKKMNEKKTDTHL